MIENERTEREKAEKEKKECFDWYNAELSKILKKANGIRDAHAGMERELDKEMDRKMKEWGSKYLYLYKKDTERKTSPDKDKEN